MAGSERSGPTSGSASLFVDRAWVVCVDDATPEAVAVARRLVEACGARVVELSPGRHDEAVASVSALPQLVSSALAAMLTDLDPAAVAIAGTGLRDLTRLADGDPELWAGIVAANAGPVRAAVDAFLARVTAAVSQLPAGEGVHELVTAGREGRLRLGGKHGSRRQSWAQVDVAIADSPGAMLDVLVVCRDEGINVEDLTVEHAKGQPIGVLHLLVEPADTDRLASRLRAAGIVVAAVLSPHD